MPRIVFIVFIASHHFIIVSQQIGVLQNLVWVANFSSSENARSIQERKWISGGVQGQLKHDININHSVLHVKRNHVVSLSTNVCVSAGLPYAS